MAQINMPTRREEKDPYDLLIKGLGVASSLYGIHSDMEKAKMMKEQADSERILKNEAAERERTTFQQQQDDRDKKQKGIISPVDAAALQKDFDVAPKGTKGARTLTVQNADGSTEQLFIMPKKKEGGGMDALAKKLDIEDKLAKRDQRNFEKTAQGRLEKMGGEVKGKIGAITTSIDTLNQYDAEFEAGGRKGRVDSRTPIVGSFVSDSKIDTLTRKLADDIGRMRSGGAINGDEEARFVDMLPRPGDDDAIAREKLTQLRNEFSTRLQAYGFSNDDLGQLGFDANQRNENPRITTIPGFDELPEPDKKAMIEKELTKRLGIAGSLKKKGGS